MASQKDNKFIFIEETNKYAKTLEEINSDWRNNLDDEMVASLLELVRGIDRLLTKPVGRSRVIEKNIVLSKETCSLEKEKKPQTIEFDVGVHLPKNFKTPLPPLNEKNCPGLREQLKDYKPAIVNPKKKK